MVGTASSSSQGPRWSTRSGFLLAAIGFAVGLGNIWRFPYVLGENGGAAFMLVYVLCVLAIGIPVLMCELLLGRRGRGSAPASMAAVAAAEGVSPRWRGVGSLTVLTAYLIDVAYCVVAGWVLFYLWLAVTGGFSVDAQATAAAFDALQASPGQLIGWTLLGLCCVGLILYWGVENGIEPAVRVLMPLLFVLLLGLAIYNALTPGFGAALEYLFTPDFSKVSGPVLLAAVGQAFFSIGVAMAGMMTFGAYLPDEVALPRSSVIIALADTVVAVVAGLVIFPIVFRLGLDPAGGPGLIFETLPPAFAAMPGGRIVGALFFLLLAVAAVTSLVGLIEPIVRWLQERLALARRVATLVALGAVFAGSLVSVLSYNLWSQVTLFGTGLGSALDFVPNQVFLPLGGLLIALFVGWRVSADTANAQLRLSGGVFSLWRNLVRYLVVPAIAVILIAGIAG
ncbi:MAG: sodium-dependent transporter [Pseudomonadota bacterium]